MNEAVQALCERLLKEHERVLLAIDGNSGAGKTTFAAALATEFGAATVHMDDFFLPPHRRTPQRLAEPGGNVDYERVREEILVPWKQKRPVLLRRYDCHMRRLCPPVTLPAARLTVVEGAYSCHPALRDFYDAAVLLTLPPEVQRARLLSREGEEGWLRFRDEWIPLENRYLSICNVADFVTLTLSAEE